MKSYKDVKRRIMALVVAAATILSSITISFNSEAEGTAGVRNGGALAQVFTAECSEGTYVQLNKVTLNLHLQEGQTIDNRNCTATIYRNLTDVSKPESGISCGADITISPVSTSGENVNAGEQLVTITPSGNNPPVYLTNGETYSVVVTFVSNMDDIVYSTIEGNGAYIRDPGNPNWSGLSFGVMTSETSPVDSATGETFGVSLTPSVVCVDTADVGGGAKDFKFEAALDPAYKRTVTYTVAPAPGSETTPVPFDVSSAGKVEFKKDTPAACGTWMVTASVDGATSVDGAEAPATATVTVVKATLGSEPVIYSGSDKPCKPTVLINDRAVPLENNFTLDYGNNTAAGTTEVTITGNKGTIYEGYFHKIPYTIEPRTITSENIIKQDYKIDTKTDAVTYASIIVKGETPENVTLICDNEHHDFDVVAENKKGVIKNGKLCYTYDVTVRGQGNTWTDPNQPLTTTVEVQAENSDTGNIDITTLLNVELTPDITYTYTGKEIIPNFTATLAGTEYDNTTIGAIADVTGSVDASETATVTFTGTGNYTGTVTKTFVIERRSLNDENVKLYVDGDRDPVEQGEVLFRPTTGETIKPKVKLKFYNGHETVDLTENTDYEVTYVGDCINPGDMVINITGNGNYNGKRPVQCTIVANLKTDVNWYIKADGEKYKVEDFSAKGCALPYTGSEQDVTVEGTIDYNGKRLKSPGEPDADFSVECIDNVNPDDTAKAIITGEGVYAGQQVTITYKITKAPLKNFGELWIDKDEWVYTGKPIEPEYRIGQIDKDGTFHDSGLEVGTDYVLSYERNENVDLSRPAKVTAKAVEGSEYYTGSLEEYFTISPRNLSASDSGVVVTVDNEIYDWLPQTPEVTLTYNNGTPLDQSDDTVIDKSNYDVIYENNVEPGKGNVTITGKENLTGEVTDKTFNIFPRELENLEWNVGGAGWTKDNSNPLYNVVYTGLDERPSIELRDGDKKLVQGEDYRVTYRNNTNPSPELAHIDITLINGYAYGYEENKPVITIDFEVTPKDISAANSGIEVTYNGTKKDEVSGKVFPDITIVDKGLRSGTKELKEGEGKDYVLEESKDKVSEGNEYDLSTSGASKIAIVKGKGCYTGTFETEPYAIGDELGTSLTDEDYVVRLKNPHTGEIATPDSKDVARFPYLGEDDKPIPILCRKDENDNVTEVPDEDIEAYGNITYTSSEENIHSVYTRENIVTVSLKGTGNYYGVVSTKYALIATTIAISSEDNNVNKALSKQLGEFDSTNITVCEVPYTGEAIGLKEIAEDLTLTHTFSVSESGPKTTTLEYNRDYSLELAADSKKSSASIIGDTVKVTAYGMGNYNGSQEFTYKIVPRDLEQCIVTTGNDKTYSYTGEPIDPTITVTDPGRNNYELKKGTDYDIVYSGDATSPGTQEFQIVGKGVYQGTLTETKKGNGDKLKFTIDRKVLSDDTIEIKEFQSPMPYTGDIVKQTKMYVIYVGKNKTESIPLYEVDETDSTKGDYKVTYTPKDPKGPGTVTMTITGVNAYQGTVSRDYYIQADMVSDVNVDITEDKTFIINPDGTTNIEDNDFRLTCNGQPLNSDDYEIDTSECTTPGKCNVYFIGKKYAGKKTKSITLYGDLSKLTDDMVKGVDKVYAYTGASVSPKSVVVNYGKVCTVDDSNYTLENSADTTNVGQATLTIKPREGTYYRKDYTKTITYDIRYDLREANTELVIEESTPSYNNDKDGVRPKVTVTSHGTTLREGTDYEVSYSNNKNAGLAKVTINSVPGKSINSQSKTFDILPIVISSDTTTVIWNDEKMPPTGEVKYKGTEWRPKVKVTRGSETLTDDVDYYVTYENNTIVGDAKVKVVGKGNYMGSIEKQFKILPASLEDDAKITVGDTYYNGGTAEPEIEVSLDGNKLTKGVDYTCEVGSEVEPGPKGEMYPTDKAYVKFEGIGPNFLTGSFNKPFTIKPINLTSSGRITLENNTAEYNGQVIPTADVEKNIKVVCKVDGSAEPYTLVKDQDYTITPSFTENNKEIKNIGTYNFLVTAEEGYGFTGTKEVAFEVTPRDLAIHAEVEVSSLDMQYNKGDPVVPEVMNVYDREISNEPLVENEDYVVTYVNNTNSASANDPDKSKRPTIIITGTEDGNYAGTEKRVYFNIGTSIEGAEVLLKDVPAGGYTYNGKVQKPDLNSVTLNGETLIKGEDYSLTEEGDFTNAGKKRVDIVGMGAYYGTAFGTYTINPAPVTDKTDNIEIQLGGLDYDEAKNTYSTTYTGSAIVPDVTVYDHAISDKPLEKDKDYTVTVNNNVNAGPATVEVTLCGNYSGKTQTVLSFTILPKDIAEDFEIKFVDNKTKYDYEGREIVPDIKVVSKAGISPSVELKEDEYSISFSNNVNAGMANVTVQGLGNYADTLSGEFMIVAALGQSTKVEVAEQFYTGEKVEPSITIECGGNVLVQGEDFIIDQNIWSESPDPFHGTAIITSNRDYYTGSIEVQYELVYSEEYLQVTGFANKYTYTMSEIKPSFKIADLSGNEISSKKFHYDPKEITYENVDTGKADCINVGTIRATIPVSVEGKDEIKLYAEYQIIPKKINACSITMINENTYNGSAIEPAVAIVYNGHELTENQEFTENYANNINPGTATVVLQGQGNYTGQYNAHFKIVPARMINLTASPVSESAIRIGWARNAKVTGYEIFSADGRKKYGTTSDTFYLVDGLNTATSYSFKVRSYVTINGATSYGDALQVTACTKVGKVSVTGSSNAPGTATLVWNRYTSVAGYEVYRSTSSNGNYKKIADVPNAYGTYTDKKVRSGNTYYYKVRAYKPINGAYSYGDFSEEIKITIK